MSTTTAWPSSTRSSCQVERRGGRGPCGVVDQSRALSATTRDRPRPGLNHLALHAGTREQVDRLVDEAPEHGWSLLFPDRHPYAGGPDTYAAYLEDSDGYEAELVGAP